MAEPVDVSIERDFKPFPVLWHASACLRDIREEGGPGSYWAGLGALITLAFAIEGFCQTEGPDIFGSDWAEGKKIERKPVLDKFKLIGRAVGLDVNFGVLPWSDVSRVLKARDSLAHPRPVKRVGAARLKIEDQTHAIDAAAHLVMEPWESLLGLEAASKIANNVEGAIVEIWARLGRKPRTLYMQGMTSVVSSRVRRPAS